MSKPHMSSSSRTLPAGRFSDRRWMSAMGRPPRAAPFSTRRLRQAGFERVWRLEKLDWSAQITLDRRLLDAD